MFKVWFLFLVAVSLPQSLKATSDGSCSKVLLLLLLLLILLLIIVIINIVDITFIVILTI